MEQTNLFGTEKISRIMLRLAPPVMLAQLIQALYNIVDSFFVGRVGFRFVGISFLPMVTSLIFPVFFQAVGGQREKLRAHRDTHGRAVCATRIYFLPVRAELVLADISGHRDADEHRGCSALPPVYQKSPCREVSYKLVSCKAL